MSYNPAPPSTPPAGGGGMDLNYWIQYMNRWAQTDLGRATLDAMRDSAGLNRQQVESGIANQRGQLAIQQGQLGLNKQQLAANMQNMKNQLANDRERIAIEKGRAEADKWYQQQQIEVAKGTLGLNLMELGAKLGGPGDYFQFLDFVGGARENPNTANWLNTLQNNSTQAGFGGFSRDGTLQPQSLTSIAAQLTGQPTPEQQQAQTLGAAGQPPQGQAADGSFQVQPGPGPQMTPEQVQAARGAQQAQAQQFQVLGGAGQAATGLPTQAAGIGAYNPAITINQPGAFTPEKVRALATLASAGVHAGGLAPGVLESMSPAELKMAGSAWKYVGLDPETVMSQYQRSRFNQGDALAA